MCVFVCVGLLPKPSSSRFTAPLTALHRATFLWSYTLTHTHTPCSCGPAKPLTVCLMLNRSSWLAVVFPSITPFLSMCPSFLTTAYCFSLRAVVEMLHHTAVQFGGGFIFSLLHSVEFKRWTLKLLSQFPADIHFPRSVNATVFYSFFQSQHIVLYFRSWNWCNSYERLKPTIFKSSLVV